MTTNSSKNLTLQVVSLII